MAKNIEYSEKWTDIDTEFRNQRRAFGQLLGSLDVDINKSFDETIGEHDPRLERIFKKLGRIAVRDTVQRRQYILPNKHIDKTRDDILANVAVGMPEDDEYNISVSVRPASLEGVQFETLYDDLPFYKLSPSQHDQATLEVINEILEHVA